MSTAADPAYTPTRPRSVWPGRLLFLGIVLLLMVWVLPIALAHSPFVGWLEQQLTERTGCSVRIGGLTLGWFRAVVAADVEIDDAAGRPLLRAGRIESRRTLLGLLLNRDDPGGFRMEQAAVEIVLVGAGSNLDDALSQLIETPRAAAEAENVRAPLPPLDLEVVDSSLRVRESVTGSTWTMHSVQASLRLFQDDEQPLEGRIVGTLRDGAQKGTLEASVAVRAEAGEWKHGSITARLGGVPLGLAGPLLKRVVAADQTSEVAKTSEVATRLTGALHGQVRLNWTVDRAAITELTVQGEVAGKGCEIVLPQLAEAVVLEHARVPFQVRYDGMHVDVVNAELVCDLGHARYVGSIDLTAPGWSWLDDPGHELSATVELVRLAEKLPRTLCIHPDLRVTSGQLRLDAHNGADEEPASWVVRLGVTNITGVRGKQPIVWHEPVMLDGRARKLGTGVPLLDELRCTSGFLTLDGATTAEGFSVRGDADLGKLADPLSRFVDLGPARLAGQVHAECTVRPGPEGRFSATGVARLRDVFVEWTRGRPLEEDTVNLAFAAAGRLAQTSEVSKTSEVWARIETARITADLGADRVQAELAEPLAALGGPDWGVWQVRLEGDLPRWQKRARAGAPAVDRWQLGGAVVAQGQLRRGVRGVECSELAVSLRDFHVGGQGISISEPTLYMHGAAAFDDAGALHLRDMQFRCPTLAATASRLQWQPDTGAASGAVMLRCDLGRLKHWLGDAGQPIAPLDGEIDGQVELHPDANGMRYAFHGTVQGLIWNGDLLSPRGEPAFAFRGRGQLEPAEDRLVLGPVHIGGPLGALVVQARLANLSTTCDLDLRGECEYDLPRLAALLDPALDVRIAGKDTRTFAIRGSLYTPNAGGLQVRLVSTRPAEAPLQLRALRGDASFGMQSLHAPGCDIGPAEVRFYLQQGWLQLYPLETTFNGGRLHIQPHLRLDPGPPQVVLLPGPVIEKARITPELCAAALGHALPALGHVTEVDGTMSVILEGGRIPVTEPARAEIKGKIILHGARFGPGPLSRELAGAFKTAPPSCVVAETAIPFHLQGGRIYHRDLEVKFPDFTMRTSGSVGLDGSLAMLVEMPVPVKLLGATKISPALARQTIRLPIIGTVDEPRIDQHALHTISAQIMREIAADALERELERKLNGLFRK